MLDKVDLHTHTIASGHAYNTIYEMVKSAKEKGAELIGISDHGPAMEGSASKHYFRSSGCIPRDLFGMKLLFGCELNIMDTEGHVDLDAVFSKPLDYAIASLHDVCITPGSMKENTRAYCRAMENPVVWIIGHPDDGVFPTDFDELARTAAEHHVLIELNEASVKPGSYRKNGRENAVQMLRRCEQYGAKVVVSSDAHIECNILRHDAALALLDEVHFPQELVVNLSAQKALKALEERKKYCGR